MQITLVAVRVPIYYSLSIIFRAENNLFNSNFCRAKVRDNLYMLNNRVMAKGDGREVGFQDGGYFSRKKTRTNQQPDIYSIPKLWLGLGLG